MHVASVIFRRPGSAI
ncbi:hypothetical protein BIW11_06288 [Tropilaelaps mercedesae]|uniref:Uncharacterized protein n=1 Tax=Tropilaelaps mercedesae TaxID=418985 RepID=A0A1V9XYP2_9ACAR|nr:hypothetical protein BIW11_06288 [Tropilaelaps mercedesae]